MLCFAASNNKILTTGKTNMQFWNTLTSWIAEHPRTTIVIATLSSMLLVNIIYREDKPELKRNTKK